VPTKVRSIRAGDSEWRKWTDAADHAGLTLNCWIRLALGHRAELEAVLRRQKLREEAAPRLADQIHTIA